MGCYPPVDHDAPVLCNSQRYMTIEPKRRNSLLDSREFTADCLHELGLEARDRANNSLTDIHAEQQFLRYSS